MHEMALTRDVVDTVVTAAQKAGATKVNVVRMTIGYGRDVVQGLFDKCFAYLARGTIAQDAELIVARMPLTVRCRCCGDVHAIDVYDDRSLDCPMCGKRDYLMNSGLEFRIDEIEAA